MYLRFNLADNLPYLYDMKYFNNSDSELYTDDGIEMNLTDIGPIASGCYAGKGRLRKGEDAQAMQDRVDYPIFLKAQHDFKEHLGEFRDYYIEVPIVLNSDILTQYSYKIRHNGLDSPTEPLFWTESDWETYWDLTPGSFNSSVHGQNFHKKISIADPKQNPGIFYLMHPYYGPIPGESDFEEEYYQGEASLIASVATGGSIPQEFILGNCFNYAARERTTPDYEAFLKVSIIRDEDSNGTVDIVDGYKSVIYNMLDRPSDYKVSGLGIRITLTTPLPRDLDFIISLEPAFSTLTGVDLIDSIPVLEEVYGLTDDTIMSVIPTPSGIPNTEFKSELKTTTILAGSTISLLPITLNRPVDGRYALVARVHSFDNRDGLKILNNDILITNTMHTADTYDDSDLAVSTRINIYDSSHALVFTSDSLSSIQATLPKGDDYLVEFVHEYFNRLKTEYRLGQGLSPSITDRYTAEKHHKFSVTTKSDGNLTVIDSVDNAPSRVISGWLIAGGSTSKSLYSLPSSISGSAISFECNFGYNYGIVDSTVTTNATILLNINLT